jgi:thioredoxin 1
MPLLTADPDDRRALAQRCRDGAPLVVVAMCAAWCDTCNAFRTVFERLATARPDALFVWLDIEDDATLCGDIDVENFPTLAVFRDEAVLHYGVSLPHEGTVDRLLSELSNRFVAIAAPPDEVAALAASLLRGNDR